MPPRCSSMPEALVPLPPCPPQVIAVCKSADLLLMVLDANKPLYHKEILTRELESVGIRLNRSAPNIYFKKRKTGGVSINSTLMMTHMDEKLIFRVLQVRRRRCRL
jgi:ribosome-interacting GTPase 1